jgi:membrane protein
MEQSFRNQACSAFVSVPAQPITDRYNRGRIQKFMSAHKATSNSSILASVGTIVALAGVTALIEPPPRPDESRQQPRSSDEPLAVHHARASERGRGRRATGPTGIPLRGWRDIFWRTLREAQEDRLLAVAAGVVFYALLALFPAVTAFVSLYGLFADVGTIRQHIEAIQSVLPDGAVGIVESQVAALQAKGDAGLSIGFAIGLGLALWSANAGMKAVIDALNLVYEEEEKRGFFKLTLISLAFTGGAIAALLIGITAIVVVPLTLERIGLGFGATALIEWLRWPVLLLCLLGGFALLYRYGPSRANAQWRWLTVGSIAAALTWLAGSALFSYYLKHYANYDATYGSLGTAIGLMMWLWMSAIVTLVGAELNAEIEHQTARDSTDGAPMPLGARGATMADTVGRSW